MGRSNPFWTVSLRSSVNSGKKKGQGVPAAARTLAIWVRQPVIEQPCSRWHSHDARRLLALDTQHGPQHRRWDGRRPGLLGGVNGSPAMSSELFPMENFP